MIPGVSYNTYSSSTNAVPPIDNSILLEDTLEYLNLPNPSSVNSIVSVYLFHCIQ